MLTLRGPHAAAAPGAEPLDGALVAWVRLRLGVDAEIRLAHLGPDGRVRGTARAMHVSSDPGAVMGQVRASTDAAYRLACSAAAQSWQVDPRLCALRDARIVARDRSIAYRAWVDIV